MHQGVVKQWIAERKSASKILTGVVTNRVSQGSMSELFLFTINDMTQTREKAVIPLIPRLAG